MSRYLSFKQAVSEFRVSAKKLMKLTGEAGGFPLRKWGDTLVFDSADLEKRLRWRKSRSERATEVPYVLLGFSPPRKP
jgi:hypothetical protein